MIIKTLQLIGPDVDDAENPSKYYPGTVVTFTTDTEGYMPGSVVVLVGEDLPEPISFSLEEVKAMQAFLSEIMYEAERKRHDGDSVVAW